MFPELQINGQHKFSVMKATLFFRPLFEVPKLGLTPNEVLAVIEFRPAMKGPNSIYFSEKKRPFFPLREWQSFKKRT